MGKRAKPEEIIAKLREVEVRVAFVKAAAALTSEFMPGNVCSQITQTKPPPIIKIARNIRNGGVIVFEP